jgi:bifunctional N-acetylglucosamine-1-phosphate-uridyltransferase/glucosamine-1-phosphate-acetyltransferase GlmU-like protein
MAIEIPTGSLEILALAGGKGTRANSPETGTPKALLEINNKPLLEFIVLSAEELGICPIVSIGFLGEKIVERFGDRARWVSQDTETQRGTASAVRAALSEIKQDAQQVLIVPGDHGYIYSQKNYQELWVIHRETESDITIVAFNVADPSGYGRVILDESGDVVSIVEQKHLTSEQSAVDLINSGTMMVNRAVIDELVNAVEQNTGTGEFYLTDIVAIARERGMGIGVYVPSDITFRDGINTLEQLAEVQK